MPELTFFRQKRHDEGIRMGIELDGKSTLLVDFQPGLPELEYDPMGSALLWYVDIRCRGKDLPRDPGGPGAGSSRMQTTSSRAWRNSPTSSKRGRTTTRLCAWRSGARTPTMSAMRIVQYTLAPRFAGSVGRNSQRRFGTWLRISVLT